MPVARLSARTCDHVRHWHLYQRLVADVARLGIELDVAVTVGGKQADLQDLTRAVELGASEKNVDTLLAAQPAASNSQNARDLLLDVLEAEGPQESDQLDARIAQTAGLAAGTVKNLRLKLKDEGLVKMLPDKDEQGTIRRWRVHRTQAVRG